MQSVIGGRHGNIPHWLEELEIVKVSDSLEHGVEGLNVTTVKTLPTSKALVVMGATIWRLYEELERSSSKMKGWFDIVVIDEASQLAVADSLIPLCCLKPHVGRLFVLGDTMQLPPILTIRFPPPPISEPNLHASILECLLRDADNKPINLLALARGDMTCPDHLIKLDVNHRMNVQLSRFTSRIYGKDYRPPPPLLSPSGHSHDGISNGEAEAHWCVDMSRLRGGVSQWCDDTWEGRVSKHIIGGSITDPTTGALSSLISCNLRLVSHHPHHGGGGRVLTPQEVLSVPSSTQITAEAMVVGALMRSLSLTSRLYATPQKAAKAIFACTPHRRQRTAVKAALAGYDDNNNGDDGGGGQWDGAVDTVERVQGQERPLVVLCLGGFFEVDQVSRERDFLFSLHRLNVAISRGKQCVIICYTDALLTLNPDIISDPQANAAYTHLRAFIHMSTKIDAMIPLPPSSSSSSSTTTTTTTTYLTHHPK